MTKVDAMLDAGYSDSMARTGQDQVFKHPEVVKEMNRRQKIAATKTDLSLEWVLERLKTIAEADLGDVLELDDEQNMRINYAKMTPQLKYALSKFTVSTRKVGRGEKSYEVIDSTVSLADKLRALELIVKHGGFSKEKQTVQVEGELSVVEQLQRGRSRAGLEGGKEIEEDA
jgi:phage terminase small subunit